MRHPTTLLVAALLVGFAVAPASAALIAHYNGEETASPLVDQAGGQTAAAAGAGHLYGQASAPAGTYGSITLANSLGNGVGISGSNHGVWALSPAESAELNTLTNNFTVMAWVYIPTSGIPSGTIKAVIGDTWGWDGDAWNLSVRNKDYSGTYHNTIEFTGNGVKSWDTANDVLIDGAWQHVAVTKSSTTGVDFYHNGVFKAPRDTTKENDNLIVGNDGFGLGRANNSSDSVFNNGLLFDEVRVYDTVLDANGIIAAAEAGQITTVIPEPVSFASWGLFAVLGLVCGVWRRRK